MAQPKQKGLGIVVVLATLLMIGVNVLAGFPIINGMTTAQISDLYPNLFTPAGQTFAIWGIIYLALLVFSIAQLVLGKFQPGSNDANRFKQIRILYTVSCVINILWLLLWQYNLIGPTVLLMLVLLVCLILIMLNIRSLEAGGPLRFISKMAFGFYLGWITVATIANITVFLVSIHWDGFGISPQLITMVILVVGALIGSSATLSFKNPAYGLVLLWAYYGVLIQHLPSGIHKGQYPAIITTLYVCLVLFAICTILSILLAFKGKKVPKSTTPQ